MWLKWLFSRIPKDSVTSKSKVAPVIGIQGTPVRACRHCNAPGVWQSATNSDWDACPGVQLPVGDERIGHFVGRTCPNCGYARPMPEASVTLWATKPGWLMGWSGD